ncbi:hypothetical protein LSH36_12g14040 [Paralvinella palmiformis]|uniref:PID domain-containing protein n=1 Tax=Paralvinella palmiformis TaxID=53620 RepID=A0AAD9KDC1_9ANNE|nr:hypothetical protein LSH36_12g14040 [Paralvinella palmiformis]
MASMFDRGDSYRVQYLGSNVLAVRAVTGLGVLQKPLMEMYFRYQKDTTRSSVLLQERRLAMNDKGMIVLCEGDADSPAVDESYAMPSILFWDAVRFVSVRTRDKKIRAAFEPLDNDHSRNKENLFVTLDKSLHFIHKKHHPTLFCCVLRRTQGLKALDVHAFVCYSDEEALGLVRALDTVNTSYTSEEQQETGVFGYNPFGKESISSAAGLQLALPGKQSSLDKRNDDVCRPQSAHFRPSEGAAERPNGGRPSTRSVSVRNKHSRVKSPHRPVSQNYQLFTGSQPNLSVFSTCPARNLDPKLCVQATGGTCTDRNSRVFHLSQEDFSSQLSLASTDNCPTGGHTTHRDIDRTPSETPIRQNQKEETTHGYVHNINQTLARKDERHYNEDKRNSGAAVAILKFGNPQMRSDNPNHYNGKRETSDQHVDKVAKQPSFGDRGIFQEDRGYLPDDKTKESKQSSTKRMGQGYSLLSRSSGPLPGYAPHQNSRQPYAPSPAEEERPVSSIHQHTSQAPGTRSDVRGSTTNLNRDQTVVDTYYNVNQLSGVTRGERLNQNVVNASPAPMVPPHTPILRKTNSLRGNITSPEQRQTIQGTVMAQLTPHSERGASPFTSRRGPPGIATNVWDREPPGSQSSNQTPMTTHSKPIAKVPPHKVQGVKVLPSQPSFRKGDVPSQINRNLHKELDNSAVNSSSDMPKEDKFVQQAHPSSLFDDKSRNRNFMSPSQYFAEQKTPSVSDESAAKDIYAIVNKTKKQSQQPKVKNMSKSQQSLNNWQFQRTPTKEPSSRIANQSFSNDRRTFDDSHSESLIQSEKKDAEIASLLQNIKFDYEATLTPHAPHGTNFEKSLGYFP